MSISISHNNTLGKVFENLYTIWIERPWDCSIEGTTLKISNRNLFPQFKSTFNKIFEQKTYFSANLCVCVLSSIQREDYHIYVSSSDRITFLQKIWKEWTYWNSFSRKHCDSHFSWLFHYQASFFTFLSMCWDDLAIESKTKYIDVKIATWHQSLLYLVSNIFCNSLDFNFQFLGGSFTV